MKKSKNTAAAENYWQDYDQGTVPKAVTITNEKKKSGNTTLLPILRYLIKTAYIVAMNIGPVLITSYVAQPHAVMLGHWFKEKLEEKGTGSHGVCQ